MRVECTGCHKIYNFKDEKVPDSAFTFACKQCGGKVRITKEKLAASRAEAEQAQAAAAESASSSGGSKKSPLVSINTDKIKKPLEKSAEMVAGMAEWSEKDWIFKLTKIVAFFSIACLVILIVLCGFTYFSIGSNSTVSFAEVQRSLELKMDPLVKIQAAAPGIKLPGRIKKYIGDENRTLFIDWMNGLDQSQKKQFLTDLEKVIRKAEKKDPTHVTDYITEYGNLTFRRTVEKPYAKHFFKYGLIIAMVTLFGLLAVFSLILLRISSRKTDQTEAGPAADAKKAGSGRKSRKKAGQLQPASG